MSQRPVFLILTGDGINCERETALAFEQAGGQTRIQHVNDLLVNPSSLQQYDGLAIPGGFSFGDDLGSGLILGLKLKYALKEELLRFVEAQKPIIGICNGFQVLTKLGLLPDYKQERQVALAQNIHGRFMNQWASMTAPDNSICVWTKGIKTIQLPVRHKEGRVVFSSPEALEKLKANGQIVFRYDEDINGSTDKIAGICDSTGLIFGLMPHPEAFVFQETAPQHQQDSSRHGEGFPIFHNIIQFCLHR